MGRARTQSMTIIGAFWVQREFMKIHMFYDFELLAAQNESLGGICDHPSIFDHQVRYLASETTAPHRAFLNTSLGVHKKHSTSAVLEIRSVGDFR
jgi:hypothetical protein